MHPIRTRAAASLTAVLPLLVLAACGDTDSGSAAGDTSTASDTAEVGTFEPSDADSGIATADIDDNSDLGAVLPDAGAGYGAPCTDDADCESSLCIVIAAGADEGICSVPCADNSDCAEGSDCVLITNNGQDATRVCVPRGYCLDRDSDGYGAGPGCAGPDCDDANETTYLGADELCDGVDNDCDDQIDDNTIGSGQDCDTGLTGVCSTGVTTCEGGLPACQQRSGSTIELCNGLDDDCDGEIDEDADNAPIWYRDADNDRFGDPADTIRACARPEGYVDADGDCDDTRATSSPVAIEVCDGLDNDCDDEVDEGVADASIASCDGDPATGCETDLSSSAAHCGACGVACDEGVSCVEGVCGCPEGQVECDGACVDANACGGCGALTDEPAAACGSCGAYACDGTEAVVCVDPGTNTCGGCGTLDAEPETACGACGEWTCDGGDAVTCVDPGTNACGGCGTLGNEPETPCGACGAWACDGADAVTCVDPGTNACGGCGPLDAEPETTCGACGEWTCDGGDAVTCVDPGTNACGGCVTLAASPGSSCGSCGSYVCDGTDNVVCDGPDTNACGGCGDLTEPTTGTCGYCDTGAWQCTGPDASACVGATNALTDSNNCGACGVVCEDGRGCVAGACTCPPDQVRFTSQPASQALCTGASVSFVAGVVGEGLTYRWQRNTGAAWADLSDGAGVSGAATPTLNITSIDPSMSGHQFRLRVTASCSSALSNAAALNVNTAPTGVSASASPATICPGAALSLSALGIGATGWSWSGPGGFSASSQNTTRSNVAVSHSGTYTVSARNACGSTNATTTPVVVTPPPTITSQPGNRTVCTGAITTFMVGATGDGLGYQWQVSTNGGSTWTNLSNGGPYSGVTSATLTVTASTARDNYRYRAVVTGRCDSVNSAAATLSVNTAPTGVTANASPNPVCPGTSLSLVASASGATNWSWSGPGGYSATTQNPTRSGITTGDAGVYTVSASNSCGSTNATTSAVSVTTPASVFGHPGNRSVCTGATTTFTVAGAGTGVSYRWQVSTNSGSTWTDISNGGAYSGATSTTLSVNTSTGMNNYRYRAVASGPCNSVNSNPATLTVNTAPTGVTATASPNPVCATTTLSLNANASGATNWSWTGPAGFSSTAQNTTRGSITNSHAGTYSVTASNSCGSAGASTASVVVQSEPVVTSSPVNRSVCAGASTTFSVSGTGTSVSWRWQVSTNGGSSWSNINNGGAYSGATTTTLSVTASSGMNGYRYRAQATGPCGSAGSGTATLSVTTCTPGACGSANGGNTTSAPTTNLCSAGTPSAVTGSGPYAWTCTGTGGAGNASCSSNRSCSAVSRNWTVGGQTCSASLAARNHTGSVSVSDATTPTVGSASFSCNQGTWTQSAGATCTNVTSTCPDQSSGGATTWFYQWADQGSDGYWYCLREYGSTEYGRCEDESYDVERLNGPAASCSSDHRSGECCDSYLGNVCSSSCSGSLCAPTSGSCSGNCNGTSYLRNCDIP